MAAPITIDIKQQQETQQAQAGVTPAANVSNGGGNATTNGTQRIMASMIAQRLGNAALAQGKQLMSMSISNYGTATGNYLMQERLENTISNLESVISTGVSAVTAFAINPILGAVNLGIQAVSTGISVINSMYNVELQTNIKNAQAAFNSANLGVILTNGSR